MTTPFPADRARQPLGIFRAITCRDASSAERDGQAIYDLNHLTTADGRPEAEVQFGDGMWLLADPTRDVVPAFTFDAWPERRFTAYGYGETWNGWDTPVVDKATLEAVCALVEADLRWEGSTALVAEPGAPETPLEASGEGLYSLAELGWTPLRIEL